MTDELVRCDDCGSLVSEEPHGMSLCPHKCTERQRERAAIELAERELYTQVPLHPDHRPYMPEESE
jgi:hypothetical protein